MKEPLEEVDITYLLLIKRLCTHTKETTGQDPCSPTTTADWKAECSNREGMKWPTSSHISCSLGSYMNEQGRLERTQ